MTDVGNGYGATARPVRGGCVERSGGGPQPTRAGAAGRGRPRPGRIDPMSTRSPDDAGPPPARCRVTVKLGNWGGGTPAHNVTFRASLNVPTGTRTPAALFSQAS